MFTCTHNAPTQKQAIFGHLVNGDDDDDDEGDGETGGVGPAVAPWRVVVDRSKGGLSALPVRGAALAEFEGSEDEDEEGEDEDDQEQEPGVTRRPHVTIREIQDGEGEDEEDEEDEDEEEEEEEEAPPKPAAGKQQAGKAQKEQKPAPKAEKRAGANGAAPSTSGKGQQQTVSRSLDRSWHAG